MLTIASPERSGSSPERLELANRYLSWQRSHAAIRAGVDSIRRGIVERLFNYRRNRLGRFDLIRRHIDGADEDFLVLEMGNQRDWHLRARTFERYLLDAACVQYRENFLILTPFGA